MSTFITDPFLEDKKPTRKPRQTFTPESFTRYRFTPTGTPVLLTPPPRGPAPSFSETQTSFNLRRNDGVSTTIQRSSILASLNPNPEPRIPEPLPALAIPLTNFSDYALCPANGVLFRYKSPRKGVWDVGSRRRIQGRRHGDGRTRGLEYFRLLNDESGTHKHLTFEMVLAAAGLTTRQFAQKFKGSTFFVDGVPQA